MNNNSTFINFNFGSRSFLDELIFCTLRIIQLKASVAAIRGENYYGKIDKDLEYNKPLR